MKSKYQGARVPKQTLSSQKIAIMVIEKTLIIILLLLLSAGTPSCAGDVRFCVFDDEGSSSSVQRLEQKLGSSDVVLAGYTRHEYSHEVEFLVLNVFKGEPKVASLFQNRKLSALESALNRRLVNVTGFVTVEPRPECLHGIKVGETYLLFAKFTRKSLILDGTDAIQAYSKGREEEVKKLIQIISAAEFSDSDQNEWNTCSKSCGGGIQIKKRPCTDLVKNCSPQVLGIQRSCNTFPCIGLTDVLQIVGLKQSLQHQDGRPASYRITSNSSWNSTAALPAGGFPAQFSLMIAIRSAQDPVSGFLFRLLQNGHHIQVAVHLSKDTVSLVLPEGLYVRFKQENKLKHGMRQWMSFSIRRNTVTFFLDCKPSGVLPATIAEDSRKLAGIADYVIGSTGNKDRSIFQGEVEQILFAEAPSAAAEQCSVLEQPLEHAAGKSSSESFDVGVVPPKKTTGIATSISTKLDDEDFAFKNDDDGSGSFYDDEYDDVEEEPSPDIKKAVLLLSESPDKDEDDEIENDDLSNFLHNKISDDVDREEDDDEEDYDEDEDDEEETGSGFASPTKAVPEWTDWSECSRTCDWGVRSRTLITPCTAFDYDDDTCTTAQPQQKQSEPCFKVACPTPTTTTKPRVTRKKVTRKDDSKPLTSWKSSWAKIGSSRTIAMARTSTEYHRFSKHQTVKTNSAANCKPNCQNEGICSAFERRCICKKGFYGRYCEKAACDGLCENGGICAQHGRCLCLPGFYGIRCEFRKCNFVAVKRPYEKSFKKKIVKEEKFPCGAWGWKKCSRKKVYYTPVFQTFYRTEYVCGKENLVLSEG